MKSAAKSNKPLVRTTMQTQSP